MSHVAKVPFVEQLLTDQYVDAHLTGPVTHTKNVSNTNVKLTTIAHLPKLVYQMNVSILVIELFVDLGQNAKLKLTELFATVLLVLKEILLFHVQKLDVLPIRNVHLMKNVITCHLQAQEKNVNLYV